MRKYVDYLIVTGTMHENIAITTVIVIPILFEVCNYYSYKFYFSIKKKHIKICNGDDPHYH